MRTLAIFGLSGLLMVRSAMAEELARVLRPLLPPPVQTPNAVPLSPGQQLGKDIFFDHTLSNPEGYACATCHIPQSGFTGPSSLVNRFAGPVPGVIPGRFGRRKPQSIPYATFSPAGPYLNGGLEGGTYLGGNFWDGRAPDTATQARMPFLDQNEMANTPDGPYPPHAGGFSPLVVQKLRRRPYTTLFQNVFGRDVFETSTGRQIYDLMTAALAMYEASAEINQFSSKFDASTNATPPLELYTFNPSEENGRQLFFGKAQCSQCHSAAALDPVLEVAQGKETFTMYCYANIGVPKNPGNPFYINTNCDSNPEGCNPLGPDFIDYGLGANPNPAPDGTLFMNATPGDIQEFRGLFKAPSLRNVDLRPYPGFVKSYMHNGVFKSLEEVVHFYNKRNIATNSAGLETEFNLMTGPPAGFTPLFPPPEVIDNVQNVSGFSPTEAGQVPPPPDISPGPPVAVNGQVGNLQLTAQEEADLVNFLKTLTDGYIHPTLTITTNVPYAITSFSADNTGTNFVVCWQSVPGVFYSVLTNASLGPIQSWALAGSPMMATNTTMCCTLPGGNIGNTHTFVMIKQQ
jgi:cytochrome c peroxidase